MARERAARIGASTGRPAHARCTVAVDTSARSATASGRSRESASARRARRSLSRAAARGRRGGVEAVWVSRIEATLHEARPEVPSCNAHERQTRCTALEAVSLTGGDILRRTQPAHAGRFRTRRGRPVTAANTLDIPCFRAGRATSQRHQSVYTAAARRTPPRSALSKRLEIRVLLRGSVKPHAGRVTLSERELWRHPPLSCVPPVARGGAFAGGAAGGEKRGGGCAERAKSDAGRGGRIMRPPRAARRRRRRGRRRQGRRSSAPSW